MPFKFGIVGIIGKLLVRKTTVFHFVNHRIPFRERRWNKYLNNVFFFGTMTSSSQSASADWLSDNNGRMQPVVANQRRQRFSGRNGLNSHFCVSFCNVKNDGRFLGWSVFQAHMQESATTKERSEFASCWFRHDLPTLDWYSVFFLFYLLSFASLAMAKTEEFEEKIKRSTSCKEVENSDTVTAGSGSVDVDEELPQPKKKAIFASTKKKALFVAQGFCALLRWPLRSARVCFKFLL